MSAKGGNQGFQPKLFTKHAKPLTIHLLGHDVVLTPCQFASGSFGWSATDKLPVKLGTMEVRVQVCFNAVVIGSKPGKKLVQPIETETEKE